MSDYLMALEWIFFKKKFIIIFWFVCLFTSTNHQSPLSQYNNLFIIIYMSNTCSKACTILLNVWEVDPCVKKITLIIFTVVLPWNGFHLLTSQQQVTSTTCHWFFFFFFFFFLPPVEKEKPKRISVSYLYLKY